MSRFVVVAPSFVPSSNGIKVIHKLCHSLNAVGCWSRILAFNSKLEVCFAEKGDLAPGLDAPALERSELDLAEDAIVVYPEIVRGNPLGAKRVVRYLLNREGYCSGQSSEIGPHDFQLAFSRRIKGDAHYTLFDATLDPAFNDQGTLPGPERRLDLTYVGKGSLYGPAAVVSDTVLVTRGWPSTQKQLAQLLRNTRLFFTWDAWSAINVEAVLCGALPVFMRYDPWSREDVHGSELGPLPSVDYGAVGEVDFGAFSHMKQQLEAKIRLYVDSWDLRVLEFARRATAHFAALERTSTPAESARLPLTA